MMKEGRGRDWGGGGAGGGGSRKGDGIRPVTLDQNLAVLRVQCVFKTDVGGPVTCSVAA